MSCKWELVGVMLNEWYLPPFLVGPLDQEIDFIFDFDWFLFGEAKLCERERRVTQRWDREWKIICLHLAMSRVIVAAMHMKFHRTGIQFGWFGFSVEYICAGFKDWMIDFEWQCMAFGGALYKLVPLPSQNGSPGELEPYTIASDSGYPSTPLSIHVHTIRASESMWVQVRPMVHVATMGVISPLSMYKIQEGTYR